MDPAELLRLKTLLAPQLLTIPGVSGVGVGRDCLNVYVEPAAPVQAEVERIVRAVHPSLAISYIPTGKFTPQ